MSTPNTSFQIRNALAEDAERLARLHVEVWRETYRNMAPAEAYQTLDEARRLPYWQDTLRSKDLSRGALLGEIAADIAGVVSFGPSSHPAFNGAGEIKHLYLRKHARGTGLGRRLLQAAFDHLRASGQHDVALAVVRENENARGFYRSLGGVECGAFIDPGPLWRSSNVIMRWNLRG